MTAADLVREARDRHRISQASLARRCRTSQTHISRIERGEVSPTVETLQRILQTMGERLELLAAPGPRGNESDADVRADAVLSPAEHLRQAAELSFALTTIAGSPSR
jgi:transcriptional regulator with XRE-family HTH domain